MKRNRWMGIFFAGVVALTAVFSAKVPASADTKWPEGPQKNLACKSAIVMELSTGTILYQKNMHKQYYPASITKILTAMLTAENCSANETVTVSQTAAYGIEVGSSTVFSEPGEKLSVEQCLNAIMLESANEVCLAVAEHISGSVDKFVDAMNARVKELGLTDTHFNNPNGLPDPKHYTSAHDMAVIAREAMKNSTFRKVCNTKTYTCAKTNKHKTQRFWINHHQMISGNKWPRYLYKYAIGGKTGYTTVAGNTLVTYAEKDGMELVCVVMKSTNPESGEPNEYTDTMKLLNFGFEKYQKYTVGEDNTDLTQDLFNNYGSYFSASESPLHLDGEAAVVLPKGVELSQAEQEITYDEGVNLKDGDNVIGHVTYTYDGRTVGSTDIIYTRSEKRQGNYLDAASQKMVGNEIKQLEENQRKDAQKANLWKKIANGVVGFFQIKVVQIVLIIIAVAVAVMLILFLFKHIELPKFGKRRKRVSGGYRSKAARRANIRQQRNARRNEKGSGRRRKNVRKHYEQKPASQPKKKKGGVNYHKKHKNTKESFGKNFFDF